MAIQGENKSDETNNRSSHLLFVTLCPLLPRLPQFDSSSLEEKTKKITEVSNKGKVIHFKEGYANLLKSIELQDPE